MRYLLQGSKAAGAALGGMLLVAPVWATAPAAAPGARPSGIAEVRAILQRAQLGDRRTEDEVVRELAELGPSAIDSLYGLFSGENVEELFAGEEEVRVEDWCTGPDRFGELAFRALGELPPDRVVAYLQPRMKGDAPVEVRLATLNLLASLGSGACMELVFDMASDFESAHMRYQSVRGALRRALTATLDGDRLAWRELPGDLEELDRELQAILVEAFEASSCAQGLVVLEELFGIDPQLDLAVVEAFASLKERYPWRASGDLAPKVRKLIDHEQSDLRRHAAVSLARLHDLGSFERLIDLLEDPDGSVRRAAHWGLEEMAGVQLMPQPEEWRRYYEAEERWWQEESRDLGSMLVHGEVAESIGAIRDLVRHPLFRHEASKLLASGLRGGTPELIRALTLALARLDSREAVPELVDVLYERDPALSLAAWRSLRSLTGIDLPPEPGLWREWADGTQAN